MVPPLRTITGTSHVAASARLAEREALLAEDELVAVERGADQRVAGLPDPRVHHPPHRLATGLLDGVPQVARLGVPVGVRAQVVADALAELLGAEVLLEHAQDGAALLVGEHVEHPVGVGRRAHLELDRAGRLQRVDLEGRRALEAERRPAIPVGTEGVARGDLHERGERLVEPDPVPPAHRHEVAEPHVGELVGDDVGDDLLLAVRARGGVDEQQALAERDAPEVLHRPGGEVGQGEEVDLLAGIGDAVVVLEPAQGEGTDVEGEAGQVSLARNVVHAQRDAVDVDRLGRFERPDDEGDEIAAHHHRVAEASPRPCRPGARSRPISGLFDTAVSAGSMTRVMREHGLELRLVPARERPPAVGRLHLRRGDDVLVAVVVDERAAVEPAQLVVEDAGELDVDRRRADVDRPFGDDDHPLVSGSSVHVAGAPSTEQLRMSKSMALRVMLVDSLDDVDGDRHAAGKRGRGEVGSEFDVVASGEDGLAQSVRVAHRNDGTDQSGTEGTTIR